MQFNWYWLLLGAIPYSVSLRWKREWQFIRIRALYWQLTLYQQRNYWSWHLSIPVIEQFKR